MHSNVPDERVALTYLDSTVSVMNFKTMEKLPDSYYKYP